MLPSFSNENPFYSTTDVNPTTTHQTFGVDPNVILTYGSQLGPYGISVYTALCSLADESGFCSPSVHQIATTIGASESTVARIVPILRSHGLVEVKSRYNKDGGQQTNQYRLLRFKTDPNQQ